MTMIDQVGAGWSKYADKTSAVQTIMSATAKDFTDTGEQMEYVNEQLDKLNWFTDETSYKFLDMVSNIGKFTSNNIPLDKSVTAMEGISTWAAKSGANVGEASRAMYNLSQALAVGSVKLMDWKSIENANMATAEFKQTAIETAEKLGTLTKAGEDTWKTLSGKEVKVSNFNEALSEGWFSSDVLLETLDKYGAFTDKLNAAMEQIDYAATASKMLEYVEDFKSGTLDIADTAEDLGVSASSLKGILTDLSDESLEFGMKAFKAAQEAKTFQEAIDSVKDAVSTQWMNTFEIIFGDYEHAKVLWTDVANGLYDIFASGGELRNEYLEKAFETQRGVTESDWAKLQESGIVSPAYIKAVREAAKEHGVYIAGMQDDESWLQKAFELEALTVEDLSAAYDKMFGGSGTSSEVNKALKEQVESARESKEEFSELFTVLDKHKDSDVSNIIFGDDTLAEGQEELEKALDTMLNQLGLTQDEGNDLLGVLKSIGLFVGINRFKPVPG